MERHGFVRVGIAVPRVHVANPRANAESIRELWGRAAAEGCTVVLFPELAITGYTCADLFGQESLRRQAVAELVWLAEQSAQLSGLGVVGLPVAVEGHLYNAAAVLQGGRILGLVPKRHIPNYKEFYERRWFTPAQGDEPPTVPMGAAGVPFGTDLLFAAENLRELVIGIEICEDLWVPVPPSCTYAMAGATLLLNLSASNETTGKAEYRRDLVVNQSGRCIAAYAYAGAGVTESTTDVVFGGDAIMAENGQLLARGQRFARQPTLLVADVDVERLAGDRMRMSTFPFPPPAVPSQRTIPFPAAELDLGSGLRRSVPAHPFVPADPERLGERCEEIFQTQVAGLAKRLEFTGIERVTLGISGGLDSTLALLVTARTFDALGRDRRLIGAVTMPGFGTSDHTRNNAERLMELLGVSADRIDIRSLCLAVFEAIGHQPLGIDPRGKGPDEMIAALSRLPPDHPGDLVFENVQARVRTLLLMSRGFVIGTGDLSELALGWCTYNADHMSMYNPNAGIPKTLVRFLVRWAADHEFAGEARRVLHSITNTEISPELLPVGREGRIQSTESTIGPYELHDFFLYHVLRFGFGPRKILYLAGQAAFDRPHSAAEIGGWLGEFYRRFFHAQFKRSCMPDGPKVGSVSLSPRGDWRMPSDAEAAGWLAELPPPAP